MSSIHLESVAFAYGYKATPVFSDVTLNISQGARVVLVGANGAGKSTLLRLVAGRRRSSAGSANVLGGDAFECTENALKVNLVTADWEAELSLPVRQLVSSAIASSGASAPRAARLLEVLGIAELLHAELHALSDGQQRRVQLFCKLLPERELILLDEATNSLDVLSRASLLNFLSDESRVRNATVVFATHIFDGLDGWATELVHLDGGSMHRHVRTESLPHDSTLYQVIAPAIQGVLAMISARVNACSDAIGSGDAAVATQAAAEIANMWTQAQAALQKYEAAMSSSGAGEVRLMPRPSDMPPPPREMATPMSMTSAASAASSSSSSLPDGWGSRQSAMSEAELVRRGIIPPPDPLSSS